MPFSDDYTAVRASKKYSPHMIQRAIEALQEAKVIREDTDAHHRRFFDRLYVSQRGGEQEEMGGEQKTDRLSICDIMCLQHGAKG
jgi:hypothetical protein